MVRYLIPVIVAGCATVNLPPSQRQQQEQSQRQEQRQEQSLSGTQGQDSTHTSDSRQGTVSQPIIIICNHVSSANSRCATPRDGEPVIKPYQYQGR